MRFSRLSCLFGSCPPAAPLWSWLCGPSLPVLRLWNSSVGITPNCPYGLKACWAGANEALGHIEGVKSVAITPDSFNCTATIRIKGDGLPDPDTLASQFKKTVDQALRISPRVEELKQLLRDSGKPTDGSPGRSACQASIDPSSCWNRCGGKASLQWNAAKARSAKSRTRT